MEQDDGGIFFVGEVFRCLGRANKKPPINKGPGAKDSVENMFN